MKLSKEIKTGLLVLVAFSLLVWGVNFLKGQDIFFTGDKYYGVYNRVDGLTDASPIFYKGFNVGVVRNIEIHPYLPNQFLVTFAIDKKVVFPASTTAKIYSLDLMGSKGIQFIPENYEGQLTPGDTLAASVIGDFVDQMSIQVFPLMDKTKRLIETLDSTLVRMSSFLDEKNQKHFQGILANVENTMANATDITASVKTQMEPGGDLNSSLKQLNTFSEVLANKNKEITGIIDNAHLVSKQLKEAELDSSLMELKKAIAQTSELLSNLNNGKGAMGKLLTDEHLYNQLTSSADNLNRLLVDVQERPKRYVHFSLLDFTGEDKQRISAQGAKGIIFQVLFEKSKIALPLGGKEIETGVLITEDYDGTYYYYTAGVYRNLNEAEALKQRSIQTYPNAEVIALENGEPINLNKAAKANASAN